MLCVLMHVLWMMSFRVLSILEAYTAYCDFNCVCMCVCMGGSVETWILVVSAVFWFKFIVITLWPAWLIGQCLKHIHAFSMHAGLGIALKFQKF